MHLDRKHRRRFYNIINALASYANDELKIIDRHIGPGEFTQISDRAREEILDRIWEEPQIITDFVAKNPLNLSRMDINAVADWKYAFNGTFAVVCHVDGYAHFLCDDKVYAVTGLSEEIEQIIPETPSLVNATLLPFAGCVVFDSMIKQIPISLPDELIESLFGEYERAMARGDWSKFSLAFINNFDHHQELRKNRENDRIISEHNRKERLADPDAFVPEGAHKGALAGLSSAERKAAIEKYEEAEAAEDRIEDYRQLQRELKRLPKGPALQTLEASLKASNMRELTAFAKVLELQQIGKMKKAELCNEICSCLNGLDNSACKDMLMSYLMLVGETRFKQMSELMATNGKQVMAAKDITPENYPIQTSPMLRSYFKDEVLTTIVPDIFVDIYNTLDHQLIQTERLKSSRIRACAFAFPVLYGMISLNDFVTLYNDYFPDNRIDVLSLFDQLNYLRKTGSLEFASTWFPPGNPGFLSWLEDYDDDFLQEIVSEIRLELDEDDDSDQANLVNPKKVFNHVYLIHKELLVSEEDESFFPGDWPDTSDDYYDEDDYYEEDYGDEDEDEDEDEREALYYYRLQLLKRHREIARKIYPVDEIEGFSIGSFIESIPEVIELRNYLDRYVPDDQDDYWFADSIVYDLFYSSLGEIGFSSLPGTILEDSGLVFNDIDQANDMLTLITTATNAIPKWINNGYSPKELAQMDN